MVKKNSPVSECLNETTLIMTTRTKKKGLEHEYLPPVKVIT